MRNKTNITPAKIQKAVSQSSKMEGVSFREAKKNKRLIQVLKSYGRAVTVSR